MEKRKIEDCNLWWEALITDEEEIDTDKIWRERSMEGLREEEQDLIRREQQDQHLKKIGRPTSKDFQNGKCLEMLRQGWNAESSPFRGQEFDPTMFKCS